jgi:oligoendopeptidase F
MEMRWSLKELYNGFETKEYQDDIAKFDALIIETNEEIKELVERKDCFTLAEIVETIEGVLTTSLDISSVVDKLYSFASLTNSCDVKDNESMKYIQLLEGKFVELTDSNVKFNKWNCSLDNLEEVIAQSEFLTKHSFYITEIAAEKEYILSDELELMYAKLQQTGSSSWVRLQGNIISTLMIDLKKDG